MEIIEYQLLNIQDIIWNSTSFFIWKCDGFPRFSATEQAEVYVLFLFQKLNL